MLKSLTTSKRLTNKDSSNLQINQNHKCYFHGQYNISKFCINKKCTLPLCEKCIPIHIRQHGKEQKSLGKESIILFSEAHKIAFQELMEVITNRQQNVQKFRKVMNQIKQQIQGIIKQRFNQVQKIVSDKENEIKILSQKHHKIRKGSLKTLIFYFANEEEFKFKSQSNGHIENKIKELNHLFEKFTRQINKFQIGKYEARCTAVITSTEYQCHKNQSKYQNFEPKMYSEQFLNQENNKLSIPIPKQMNEMKRISNNSLKLTSSSDFDLLLKEQRERLHKVKNKNIFFSTNQECASHQNSFQKGSRSVDHFYSNKIQKKNQQNKQYKQNRPFQLLSKTPTKKNYTKKTTSQDSLNNQEQIDKIRNKYMGCNSLSKQKAKSPDRQDQRIANFHQNKYLDKGTKHDNNKFVDSKLQMKPNGLSDRILSRQQIRLNIENRINQKSITPHSQIKNLFKEENHDTFRKLLRQQDDNQMPLNVNHQEFTLNKNNLFKQTQKQNTDRQKCMLSSIKKELRAAQALDDTQKETRFTTFFQNKNQQNLRSFDMQAYTKADDLSKVRQDITHFIVDRQTINERQIQIKQCERSVTQRKDQLYQQTKQKIKLSQPSLIKKEQKLRNSHESKANAYSDDKIIRTDKRTKQERKFNYLPNNNIESLALNSEI